MSWLSPHFATGFGFLAIILGVAAAALGGKTLAQLGQLLLKDRKTGAFQRLGAQPKTSDLASRDDLRKAGMLDG